MALERTLSIIKPDAVKKNVIGQILARFEEAGLRVVAARMMHLSRAEAEGFYAVHRGRPFFNDLVEFMISGPVLVQVLEGDNAIAKNRELMGATDPKKAAKGTIRADFARLHRRQRGARLRRAGNRADRDRLFFSGERGFFVVEGESARACDAAASRASSRRRARSRSAPARCCAGSTSAA